MKKQAIVAALAAVGFAALAAQGEGLKIVSPDGQLAAEFRGNKTWSAAFGGKFAVGGEFGLEMDNYAWEHAIGVRSSKQFAHWMDGLELESVEKVAHADEPWENLWGERRWVHNAWNGGVLHFVRNDETKYRLDVEVRLYDGALAFRYFIPDHPTPIYHKVVGDNTTYHFPAGTLAWAEEWAQGFFKHVAVNELNRPVERPLTLELASGRWIALCDADVDDWCATRFISKGNNTLASDMYSPVDVVPYAASPWKVVIFGDKATDLIERNDVVLDLNEPCAIPDAKEWVIPGKSHRCITLTTEGAKEAADFCAARNIPYMLLDWKWYMPVTSYEGDAKKSVPELNVPAVVEYAKTKGIKVWLYVNHHALVKEDLDELFSLYKSWGIVGIKPGFVQYQSHRWAVWVHDIVRKAAKHKLMVNIHDEFRPSGFSRTYPNLMTQEGICGNEEFPGAKHNTILPFTRMVAGAGDYTFCYYQKRLNVTHAHQLAGALVFFSPVNALYWYDKPKMCSNEPELDWFDTLPTVWDDSIPLDGRPGEFYSIARRKGATWYVAAINSDEAKDVTIDFSFLDGDKEYVAIVYTDDQSVPTKTHVRREVSSIRKGEMRTFSLQNSGGVAIRLEPKEK